jgi:site-specific recombinase XerD
MGGSTVRKRQAPDGMGWVVRMGRQCVEAERSRGLGTRSLEEVERWIKRFGVFAQTHKLATPQAVTTGVIRDFLIAANPKDSASLGKTIVWCIRKFCSFLALRQVLSVSPAEPIPQPKARPREKLPEYLKPSELSALLETAITKRSLQDLTILSLLVTAGPRPKEIVTLRRKDIFIGEQYVFLKVKGGRYKRTPISECMAETLQEYLDTIPPDRPLLFPNQWGKPIDTRWIERMVRAAAAQAGIKRRITPRILRHTFATYAADRHGISVTRALPGHSNHSHSNTTEVYMHLIPSKFRVLMNCHPYQTTVRRRNPW